MSLQRSERIDEDAIARRIAVVRAAKLAKLAAGGAEILRRAELRAVLPPEPAGPADLAPGVFRCTGCGRALPGSAYPTRRNRAGGPIVREARCRECKQAAYRRLVAARRPPAPPPLPPGMKRCLACKEARPFDEFYARRRREKPGHVELNPECMECARARTRARYAAMSPERKAHWYNRARAKVLAKRGAQS